MKKKSHSQRPIFQKVASTRHTNTIQSHQNSSKMTEYNIYIYVYIYIYYVHYRDLHGFHLFRGSSAPDLRTHVAFELGILDQPATVEADIPPTKMVMTGGWCLWHCLTDMNRDFWDLLNIIFMMLMMIMIIIITTNTILFYFYYYYYCYNQLLGPIVISGWFYTHLTPMNHAANFTKSPPISDLREGVGEFQVLPSRQSQRPLGHFQTLGGFHSHGGTPIAGWFIDVFSGKSHYG